MNLWIKGIFTSAVIAMASAISPAVAQQAQAPAAQPQAPAADYSDGQLEKFVGASKKVAMIRQEYGLKFNSTTDKNTQQKIVKEADKKMIAAVRNSGMTVDEFNSMGRAVQNDPSLMKRAQKIDQTGNTRQ